MSAVESVPKLRRPDAIKTEQGIDTLRVYMYYMKKKYNLRVVHPFSFEDMFQDAYIFLLEQVDNWNPELSNFDTWATEMMRYGWLKAVKRMHWAGYRVIDKHYLVEGRHVTRFGEDDHGRSEMDMVVDSSDEFDRLDEESHLENLLSQLKERDREIVELLIEGYKGTEIDEKLDTTPAIRFKACRRIEEALGLERPARMKRYDELTDKEKRHIFSLFKTQETISPVGQGSVEDTGARLRVQKSAVRQVVNEYGEHHI